MLRSLKKMPNGANGTSDPSTQRYAIASIEGVPSSPRDESVRLADRTGISDEGRSERARAANESQIGNKVKRFGSPEPSGFAFAASAGPDRAQVSRSRLRRAS